MARYLSLQMVVLESDNQALVEACRGNQKNGEIAGYVTDINNIRATMSNCGITWVGREGNTVAHEVARLAPKGLLTSNWTTQPPDSLRKAIVGDCINI